MKKSIAVLVLFALAAASFYGQEPIVQQGDFHLQGTVLFKYTGLGGYVDIPSGVTAIGNNAFAYCHGLTGITIPTSVRTIGHNAFIDCPGLTSINIPEGVTTIRNSAFDYCYRLTSITIPASVTSIETDVFNECSSLSEIRLAKNSPLDRSLFPSGVPIVEH